MSKVAEEHPLKQGLKRKEEAAKSRLAHASCRGTSIKTRIETEQEQREYLNGLWLQRNIH